MIEIRDLTKRYGGRNAVDSLSFRVEPGTVTGFLGPNGAGKSTTMRLLLGLATPDRGTALVTGRRYATLKHPLHQVGALLDPDAAHPGRTARDHLRALARSNRIPDRRATEVLDRVGLAGVARRRVGGFSLGMKQRLGLAAALLGDPGVLLLDEPVNGLDPDGVRWIRDLLRSLAAEGRTVLVSSHLMSEMELTADRLVVIGRGRLVADTSVPELVARYDRGVVVRSADDARLAALLRAERATVAPGPHGGLLVTGLTETDIGELAARHTIPLYGVARRRASLEDAYLALTAGTVEHRSGT
ncbi:ABC transporter ATP-binding protein [Actinocatenispora rupis]|uniref:Multidrug ABC transporter ATP-binding protein n=1 Tax=Actinocatenispora rupis TaxID=519421 RepID=A0A8J3JB94_9ACTN|nr:ABC transporter ATP-binding protein [Actinocatenispora rupis]GID15280.1 multidrug ABC transporter ATP-binding protein [Actinocatenispora rupis]